jgi:ABC-2 type transport system permease protein
MNGDERTPQTFSWTRRWGALINLFIAIGAVVAIVAMVNYLAMRHYRRFHWSQDTEGSLSRHTRAVLASLTNTVKVVVYVDSQNEAMFPRVDALLKEYEYASPHIKVQIVDYIRDGGAAKEVKERYRLDMPTDRNLVIFDMNGRTKTVSMNELSEYDYSKLLVNQTNEIERTHFKGELQFTSKIYAVANERSPVAYFLFGHGEHFLSVEKPEEYGRFALMLTNENNFEIRVLTLSGTNDVPADCNLLIVGGPSQSFERSELDSIQRYLEQGGRMLIAFTSDTVQNRRPTGLERLLSRWGVKVDENVINDPEHSARGGGDVMPVYLGKHQVVNPLQNTPPQLFRPRSISAAQSAGKSGDVKVEELLFTGPNSKVFTPSGGRWLEDETQRGSKALMAVVEKSVPALQRGSTRIVVLGDSWLLNNTFLNRGANQDFAGLMANWLVNQSVLLGDIRPRPIHTYQLTMTQAQLRSVQVVLLAGMPGAVLLLGVIVWIRRRS